MTLVLKIRDKFKCCGELLIHFLLCLLVTNILLFSHHPPPPSPLPSPPLLSKVRPSQISLRFLWRSTSSPVSPDEEERGEWMLQMLEPRSWSFVRTLLPNPGPHVLVVVVVGCEYEMLHTEQVGPRSTHWTSTIEMLVSGMNGKER